MMAMLSTNEKEPSLGWVHFRFGASSPAQTFIGSQAGAMRISPLPQKRARFPESGGHDTRLFLLDPRQNGIGLVEFLPGDAGGVVGPRHRLGHRDHEMRHLRRQADLAREFRLEHVEPGTSVVPR